MEELKQEHSLMGVCREHGYKNKIYQLLIPNDYLENTMLTAVIDS